MPRGVGKDGGGGAACRPAAPAAAWVGGDAALRGACWK